MFDYYKCFQVNEVADNKILYVPEKEGKLSENLFGILKGLLNQSDCGSFQHTWIQNGKRYENIPAFKQIEGRVQFISDNGKNMLDAYATAKYIFYEKRLPRFFVKREGQILVNIWNQVPFRRIGFDKVKKSLIWNTQKNFFACDFLVASDIQAAETILDAYQVRELFAGRILDYGLPAFELAEQANKALLKDMIGRNKKIVYFAPANRYLKGKLTDITKPINATALKLQKELGDEYVVITRLSNPLFFEFERMAAADILITDINHDAAIYEKLDKPIVYYDYNNHMQTSMDEYYNKFQIKPDIVAQSSKEAAKAVRNLLSDENRQDRTDKSQGLIQKITQSILKQDKQMEFCDKRKTLLFHITPLNKIADRELCFHILKNIDYNQYVVVMDGNDIYSFNEEFKKISKNIYIIDSKFEDNKSESEKNTLKDPDKIESCYELFSWENKSMYAGLVFDTVIDMAGRKIAWMNIVSSMPHTQRYLVCNENEDTHDIIQTYGKYFKEIKIIGAQQDIPLHSDNVTCISREEFIVKYGKASVNLLFISAFDSTNYVFVNLIKELNRRGHRCTVIVKDKDDLINNKMYIRENIPIIEIDEFDLRLVNIYDFVFSAPLKYDCYTNLYNKISSANKFIITFASLFSSVVMGVNPDLSLSLGTSKFNEFRENGLKYNLLSIGNPQYDKLINMRAKRPQKKIEEIRNVLIIEQGAYPYGHKGKKQEADTFCSMARSNPHMTFTIKPRYLPSEKGSQLHVLSEHIYDYIQDKPDNLILLDVPTVLENEIQNYDATITTWSTAYLEAALLGLPLILIEGFDSIDVYNVRNQRIDAAYKRLKESGCVVHFEDLQKKKELPFRFINEKYLEEEVYGPHEPCVPRIMEVLEFLYEKLIVPDKRWKNIHQLTFYDFFQQAEGLELIGVSSNEYQLKKRFFNDVNYILQKFIFENRCMGEVLDIESVYNFWDYKIDENTSSENIRQAIKDLNSEINVVKEEYFTNHFDIVCKDRILQDYYFQWLFLNKKYNEIMNYNKTLICAESLYFYKAVICYQKHRYKTGTRYFSKFFNISNNKECKDLRKDMSLTAYLCKGRIGKYMILYYLDRYGAYDVISGIDLNKNIYQKDVMAYFRIKSLVRQEKYNEAVHTYREYTQTTLKKRKKSSVKSKIKNFVGNFFLKKTEVLYKKAKIRMD